MQEIIDIKSNMDSMNSVSTRLSEYLSANNISQQVVAKWFGVTRQNVNGILNGKSRLTLGQVSILKKKIPNLNIEWLMFGKGEQEVDDQRIKMLEKEIEDLKKEKQQLLTINEHFLRLLQDKDKDQQKP